MFKTTIEIPDSVPVMTMSIIPFPPSMFKLLLAQIPLDLLLEFVHLLLVKVHSFIDPETNQLIAPPLLLALLPLKMELIILPLAPPQVIPPPSLAVLLLNVELVIIPLAPPQ